MLNSWNVVCLVRNACVKAVRKILSIPDRLLPSPPTDFSFSDEDFAGADLHSGSGAAAQLAEEYGRRHLSRRYPSPEQVRPTGTG